MGITNAPQGGSGGGRWVRREDNNDWSDLFDFVNNRYVAKKTMIVEYFSSGASNLILAGDNGAPEFTLVNSNYVSHTATTETIYNNIRLNGGASAITGSLVTLNINTSRLTIDFDNKTYTYTQGSTQTTFNKNVLRIYTWEES